MTHEHLAIPNPVHSAALNAPERIGLAHDGGNFTWRELSIIASEWAGALTVAGVKPGDRVALAGQPSAEWVLALHALGWVGAIVVPLPHQADDDELRHVLDISGARRVLTVGDAGETKLSARAVGDRPVWRRDELDPSGPLPERFWPLDEVRVVLLTSGTTTGQPQPVELTTAQLMFAAMGSAIRLGHHTNDRWLCCLPLNYVAGLSIMFRSAWLGITTVLHPQFNAPRVARELASGQVTMVSLVPTMLERVLDACEPGVPFHPALRCILLGGAAAPESLLERCRERRLPVSLTWGLTETAAQVATRNPGELDTRDGVGPPLPFARVDRLPGDPHGDAALQVRGPIAPAGRFRTRDLGHVDAAGCVHLEGRADALIKSGGRAISPAELEAALNQHPAIAASIVAPIPDPQWGERPAALCTQADPGGTPPDTHAVREWLREHSKGLAEWKLPDHVVFTLVLPTTERGKPDRFAARELLLGALGQVHESQTLKTIPDDLGQRNPPERAGSGATTSSGGGSSSSAGGGVIVVGNGNGHVHEPHSGSDVVGSAGDHVPQLERGGAHALDGD